MTWKEFKNWLDKNIIESNSLQISIRTEKQNEYGQISIETLTNFCDSLEATLDSDNSYHLFPEFHPNKSFEELFSRESTCFGKRTNQQTVNETDYNLLEKIFEDYKNQTKIKNILLIGRTGSGKSTLANVLTGTNEFVESARTTSQTRSVQEGLVEVDISRDGSEKNRYRVIDTIGIGDTQLTPQGVLTRLAEMADQIKTGGLNQILFVTKGRFTKEEIEAYDLLSSIIFDRNVLKYTTVVRTGFPEFEDVEACADDRSALRVENADLSHILGSVNIIYLDNPPLKGRARAVEDAKECREESRKRILTYLAGCRGNYRPANIDTLDERVREYKTNEQKLKEKMKELDESRKKQEKEFREKLAEMKEEQARELRENRNKFEDDIRRVKIEGDEQLRKTTAELDEKHRRDMADLENRNRQQISNLQDSHRREAESIKADGERQMRSIQDQMQRNQQDSERLRRELEAKGSSSNSDIAALVTQVKREGEERQIELENSAEANQRRFEAELEAKKEADKREFEHRQEMDRKEQERKDKIAEVQAKKLEQEVEAKQQANEQQARVNNMNWFQKKWYAC